MYTPRTFREERLPVLHGIILSHPFGILVSGSGSGLVATHVPFMLDQAKGPHGTLTTHVARANPHWKSMDEDTEVLVIFRGPHGYVSPGWYKEQTTVPTWNYATVHCYGAPMLVHDPEALRHTTARLTRRFESGQASTWRLEQAEPVLDAELRAIVGIEIELTRIVGKLKLSQNRSREDRLGVTTALLASPEPSDQQLGELMVAHAFPEDTD